MPKIFEINKLDFIPRDGRCTVDKQSRFTKLLYENQRSKVLVATVDSKSIVKMFAGVKVRWRIVLLYQNDSCSKESLVKTLKSHKQPDLEQAFFNYINAFIY